MAASQTTIALRTSTDAEFRALGAFINAGMIAGGWTLEDTNINWVTVTTPAQNTLAGHEIWKSPAETGLSDIYVKFQFGSNNNAAPSFCMRFEVGWSRSGSNLTGIVSVERSSQAGTVAGVATTRLCTIAVNDGEILLNLGNAAIIGGAHLFHLCRTRDTSQVKQDELLIHHSLNVSTSAASQATQVITPSKAYTSETTSALQFVNPSSANSVVDGEVGLGYFVGHRAYMTSPSDIYAGCISGVLGAVGDTISLPMFGATRTFIIGTAGASTVGSWNSQNTYNPLFLYE